MAIWQTCTNDELRVCHAAWSLQATGRTHNGLAAGDGPNAHAAGEAFVIKAWNRRGVLLTADGTTKPLADGAPAAPTGGDTLVPDRNRMRLVDGRTGSTWPLSRPAGVERWDAGAIAPDGTIWASAVVDGHVWLAWNDGATWRHHVMPADESHDDLPGYLAVAGDHVASVSGYDGATVLPVADLAVTTDGGSTWRDLHRRDLPFTYVDAMAATSGGTLYVVAENGHGGTGLFRTTDTTWTRFAELPNRHRLDVLVPAGDHVLAQGGSYDRPALYALDDAGRATRVPLSR